MRLPRFRCLFCESCCYFEREEELPTLYPWEKRRLERLAERLGKSVHFEPILVYEDSNSACVVAMYKWLIDGFCPFFDRETKKCTIHEDKPLACRMYPLVLEMPTGRLMVSGKCEWVRREGRRLIQRLEAAPEKIPVVFPHEFEAAKTAFADFNVLMELVRRLKLRPRRGLEGCRAIYDIDQYLELVGGGRGGEESARC